MPCQVKNCVITDDRLIFHCYGACGKEFHATCVGTRRNHEEQIRSYMLPLCEDCQEELMSVAKLRKLLQRQHTLATDIEAANNKMCAFINSFNVHEAFDNLESQLIELRGELKTAEHNSNKLINNVSSVLREKCNTSTFELSVQQANEVLSTNMTRALEQAFCKLDGQLEVMQHNILEVDSKELPTEEILEELKSLSNAVAALQPSETSLDNSHQLTLAEELVQELALARSSDNSGWRLLGTKKIWKADWKAYDLRQLRRRQQENVAQKARNRRKRKTLKNNRNNGFIDTNQNIKNNNRNMNNTLPTDKQLLAVAKERFSKPPPQYRPTIRFQRGPILNPHPVDDETPSTSREDSRNWMLQMTPEYNEYNGLTSARPCHLCSSHDSYFQKF